MNGSMNDLNKEFDVTLTMLLYSNDMVLANRFMKECKELIEGMHYYIRKETEEFDKISISAAERQLKRIYELVKNYNENTNI